MVPFINYFYQSERWFQLLPLQWWWICGSLSDHAGELERPHPCGSESRVNAEAPGEMLWSTHARLPPGTYGRRQSREGPLLIWKKLPGWFCSVLQVKSHCIRYPLLIPSKGCNHLAWQGNPWHLWLEPKESDGWSGDYMAPTTAVTFGSWPQAELH